MEIKTDKNGGFLVVSVSGRLDATTAGGFEQILLDSIDGGEKKVLVDFAGLDYISSSGLRVLLMGAKKLSGGDGHMGLCAVKEHIKEVFDIAGFTPVFSFYSSVEEALS